MNRDEAIAVLAEWHRRTRGADLLGSAFPVQRAFLEDTTRLKAALCTRRSGKSYGIGLYLLDGALRVPGSSQLYVALTRESAKRIMYKDVLKVQSRAFGLNARFNEVDLTVTLPNGSAIYLLGVDAKPDEADKILGQKFYRAAVDECASFRQDLQHLVYGVIRPALADHHGTLAMIGTPGNVKNFFHDVTMGSVPGWSLHKWSAKENPHVEWEKEIAAVLHENPGLADTPLFRQHYLGEWTVDTSALVYRYEAARNDVTELPAGVEWRYVLGLDLGYTDDTAVVVGAYRAHDKTLYMVYAEKRAGLIISQVADWVRAVAQRFPLHTMVVDGAAKQSVEELRQRHGLPLEAAEKSGKVDAIAMMNSDLMTGRVRVLMPACAALAEEWSNLVWDERKRPQLIEHPSCPNHLCDSATYLWRAAMNYAAQPAQVKPSPWSAEAIEQWWDDEAAEQAAAKRRPFWER